ncbi:MAG: tetratricopeptide repeat protein [Pseudomonadota bacterium]
MSLIHDALKKAQDQAKAPIGSGFASLNDPIGASGGSANRRAIILGALLFVAVAIFAYTKLSPTKKPEAAPPTSPAAQQSIGEQDVGRLKKSAIDAYNADDMDAAWASLSAALQLSPNDPELRNNLGLVARKRGDVVKARESYEKALELKADYPEAFNNLAVLEMQSGNNARAKDLLEKAIKLTPAYPEANFHMALLLEQKGEKTKAIEYYKRFLEVGKNLPSGTMDSVRDHVMEMEP